MGWRDLLEDEPGTLVAPWLGGRTLRSLSRAWKIAGRLPRAHGYYRFELKGRVATVSAPADVFSVDWNRYARYSFLKGYLVGDLLVPDDVRVEDPRKMAGYFESVHLIEDGFSARFDRVHCARTHEGGPLLYHGIGMPLGPETDVQEAYEDRKASLDGIKDVPPALDAAFRFETWRRDELERIRREEEERRELERQRAEVARSLGTAEGRRELAQRDLTAAFKAALAVGGAALLDLKSLTPREYELRFRFRARRFCCTCDPETLRIIDAGICLEDHDTGERGDRRFTLESLPGVIAEAIDSHRLHIWRHA